MYEVEIKVRIQDLDEIRAIIQINGGSYKISLLHEDTYFNMPKELRDFKNTDEAIRLRKSEEFDKNNNDFLLNSKCYLTYKGKKIDSSTKTRQEIEVKVDNLDNMKEIFKILGFQEVLLIQKERELFELLYQDEKIKASFHGEIELGAGKRVGRIYLTTFRIILIGTNKSKVPWPSQSFAGIVIDLTIQKSIVRNLQAKLSQIVSTELPCLGHQYPMFGLLKIKLGSRKVTYKVVLETTLPSGSKSRKKYLFRVIPYGKDSSELARLVHDTIVETSKTFT